SWTEALGTLSRVWGNKKGAEVKGVRSGFITATIDGDEKKRNVMLVTLPVYSEKAESKKEKGELHLWLTDNTHIVDIGPVSEMDEDEVAASSLLYESAEGEDNNNERLIALYEKKKGDEKPQSLWSVRLTEQLQRVKEVLATWKKVDETVSQLCPTASAAKSALADNDCSAGEITAGLVGFLSDSFSDNTWKDEYLGVNATVKKKEDAGETGATLHASGVTFKGAWAEWPVGEQGENQLYHFANYNFTLVATVSIYKAPEGDNPIPVMGVRAGSKGETKLMELSYNSEKKWELFCSCETTNELSSHWEAGTAQQVAIVLQNGTQGSAYVDGKRVGAAPCELKNAESEEISHFYIGGDGGSTGSREVVSVNVKNVFLYNRPLTFSGGDADLEEAPHLPPANPQPTEAVPQSVEGDQKAMPHAGKPSEAPGEQATLQQPPEERETQENTTVGESATTQQVPANRSQGSVGSAAALNSHAVGGATGDGGTVRGSGLLPSLLPLLLGLWGFAAL
ncbi:trans-sialidase, partial [Trypanosoma cruzi]